MEKDHPNEASPVEASPVEVSPVESDRSAPRSSEPRKIGPFTVRRWIAIVFFVVLTLFLMRPILDPYGEKGYMEISHGDHTHYVPRDRDPNVPVSNFPTNPPGPDERITPDGRIVPR